MTKKRINKMFIFCFCTILTCNLFAQTNGFCWDFSGCEIKDILYAVSIDTGISIVADDTVEGTGDLKFAGGDFETAFDSFLKTARLYVEKKENVWTVSRCSFCIDNGRYSLDAYDMSPAMILEKVSLKIDSVITFDSLPVGKISVHFRDLSDVELLECLARKFGAYEVIRMANGVHFSKKMNVRSVDIGNSCLNLKLNEDNSISVDLRDALFSEVIESLFEKVVSNSELGFCLIDGSDARIQRSVFVAQNFEEALKKICSQNGYCAVLTDGIYYILNDSKSKDCITFGERSWQKFFLKYTSVENILPVLYSRVGKIEICHVPEQAFFFAFVNTSEAGAVRKVIAEVDEKSSTYLVNLKYLKPEELVLQLPPFIHKEKIYLSNDNSKVYFKGTEEEYLSICEEIAKIDRNVKRISYDLLILQYDEGKQNEWTGNITADSLSMGDRNCISGQLGSVMNLNMNVLSTFGLKFATSLQASIEENSSNVFADTTLHGVCGKPINFQNTNTYRYRDNNLDPETGKPVYSGVTKEIISGITIDIQGWVSGENMVTSSVTAKVSRQGTDTSSRTGNPPPTSEKIITTEVCCKSGEPVVLSGLIQNAQTIEEKRTPILSKIPLIGFFFKAKEKISEKSQMVIYLVPHVENQEVEVNRLIYSIDWAKKQIDDLWRIINESK